MATKEELHNMYENLFSCQLYGLRKYKKQIKEDEEIAKELQDRNTSNSGTEEQD